MAHYSVLNNIEIEGIIAQYGFKQLHSYTVLSGGWENTNYVIATEKGDFVLTLSEQKSITEAKNLAHLLEHLAEQDFPSSKIILNSKNETIVLFKEKPVMLKRYIEGKIMSHLPNHLLELLGSQAAQLHKIEAPPYLRKIVWCGKERFNEVEKYAVDSEFYKWLMSIQKYVEHYISPDLPKAFIHSDIFDNNVVVSTDESCATIMDFEEAAYYYRVFDIGMMIIGLCREDHTINPKKVSHILKGYQSKTQLLDVELKALQAFTVYAAAGVAFWRHKQFNHVYPDLKLNHHYKVMKEVADYVKELPVTVFL